MKKIIVLFVMVILLTACGNEPKAEVQKIDCITKNFFLVSFSTFDKVSPSKNISEYGFNITPGTTT